MLENLSPGSSLVVCNVAVVLRSIILSPLIELLPRHSECLLAVLVGPVACRPLVEGRSDDAGRDTRERDAG